MKFGKVTLFYAVTVRNGFFRLDTIFSQGRGDILVTSEQGQSFFGAFL